MFERAMGTRRVCFVAESQVGIGSVAQTLKPLALRHEDPLVAWADITYAGEDGWLERLPLPPRVTGTARGYLQTRAALGSGHYDALLFLTQNPAVLQPRALARTPALLWTDVTPRQLDLQAEHYSHARSGNKLAETLKHAAVRHALHVAHRCVGWSDWARRSFVSDYGVPEERTRVVSPGIDLSRWQPPERHAADTSAKVRLLFVGGDFRRKGGPLLVDAFRAALRANCELDIVTRESVEPEPGIRVHHGLTAGSDALLDLYRRADLFVLPTLADCHSIASLEAMAMGLPALISDVGANREVVEDGHTGWLVPPADGQALTERLSDAVRDAARLRAFGAAGLARVRSHFDAQQTLEALLRIALEGAHG